jgi:hypothetical protein
MTEQAGEAPYQLTLNGNGLSVQRNIHEDVARHILNVVLGGAPIGAVEATRAGLGHATPSSANARESTLPPISLREFIDNCGAKRNPDRILAIGIFMMDHEGAQDFGREEVKARFRTAGEPVPGNYPRDFAWTIHNGWIAEDPANPARHYVTRKGKDAIAQKFSTEVLKGSAQKPASRKRTRRSPGTQFGGPESE